MHNGSTKMVSVAQALSTALGADSTKYEEAMAKRLEQESRESLPSDALPDSLGPGEFFYTMRTEPGTVYIGTQDHFDWTERNGGNPHLLDREAASYLVESESWVVVRDEPLGEKAFSDVQEYRKDKADRDAFNDMRAVELDDPWLDYDSDEEDPKPLKQRERKDKKKDDKERTLQRRTQRERKIIYQSNDEEVPVFAYGEDWDDARLEETNGSEGRD